jgi:hypothetical protein
MALTRLDFGDFYKFLCSLGLLLLGAAAVLPWLFLREHSTTLVHETELEKLTPTAKALVVSQQETLSTIVDAVPLLSIVVAICGVASLLVGGVMWARRQRVVDEQQRLAVEKTKAEIRQLPFDERVARAEKEAKEEARASEAPEATTSQGGGHPDPFRPDPSRVFIAEAMRVEASVGAALEQLVGTQGKVFSQVMIGRTSYDTVVQYPSEGPPDLVVEVKFFTQAFRRDRIAMAVDKVQRQLDDYVRAFGKAARGVVLCAAPAVVLQDGGAEAVRQLVLERFTQAELERVSVRFVDVESLYERGAEALAHLLRTPNVLA